MNPELLREADDWMTGSIRASIAEQSPRDDYRFIVWDVLHKLPERRPEFQQAAGDVLKRWLLGSDRDRIMWALMLVELLEATEFITALTKLRWRVLFKLSPLPWNELGYMNAILKSLRQKERGNR
jgi:hypothetical protein